jgi:hypothetical protein
MGWACGTQGREDRCTKFWWENLKERYKLEDRREGEKIISNW